MWHGLHPMDVWNLCYNSMHPLWNCGCIHWMQCMHQIYGKIVLTHQFGAYYFINCIHCMKYYGTNCIHWRHQIYGAIVCTHWFGAYYGTYCIQWMLVCHRLHTLDALNWWCNSMYQSIWFIQLHLLHPIYAVVWRWIHQWDALNRWCNIIPYQFDAYYFILCMHWIGDAILLIINLA